MKIGDKAITKYPGANNKLAGEVVEILQVRLKKDGFSRKNYLVKYPDGSLGSWTRWELKRCNRD
jgi:peptidoglycan hydrolase-like protein with peptidoglycan-binding domain